MNAPDLLRSYHEAAEILEPATLAQIEGVEGFVEGFLDDVDVEPGGDSLASWYLPNGVQVNVRSTMNHRVVEDEEGGEKSYSTMSYDIDFKRYFDDDKPEAERSMFAELSYGLLLPTPGSRAAGLITRQCSIVDLEKTYMYNAAHAKMSREEFDQSSDNALNEYWASLEEVSEVSRADVAMLIEAMSQTTAYASDPFVLLGDGKLIGSVATPADIEQLAPLIEAAAAQGYIRYGRHRGIELPQEDPSYTAAFRVFQDASEHGPFTNLAQQGSFPAWIIRLVLEQDDDPITEELRLEKTMNGKVGSHRIPHLPIGYAGLRYMQDNPEEYERYKRADRDRNHAMAVKKSMGLDEATAAEVNWFQKLISTVQE